MSRADPSQGPSVTVPPTPAVDAVHNGPKTTTMWKGGRPIVVANEDIPQWQAEGFLLYAPEDLVALAVEVEAMGTQAISAVHAFVADVGSSGAIGTHENSGLHAMTKAVNLFNQKVQDVMNVAGQTFPVAETAETADELKARIAADADYHGISVDAMKARYGMTEEES